MKGRGIVVSINGKKARVKVTTQTECAGCAAQGQCHSGGSSNREITVLNEYGAGIEDHVVFEAEAMRVIFSAVLIWIVPLCSMIIGYFVAQMFSGGVWPIAAAFAFLGISFAVLKVVDHFVSGGRTFYPRITRIVSASMKCDDI